MMNNRTPHHRISSFTDLGKGLPVVLLFIACLLASGCATVNGKQNGEGIGTKPSAEQLPFPAPHRAAVTAPAAEEPEIEPTVVSYPHYRDPLVWMNRGIFAFNDVTYRFVLIPLSKGYMRVIPDPVHRCIGNFFYNIKMPVYAVNHLLQLKPKPMGRNLLRFGINTTGQRVDSGHGEAGGDIGREGPVHRLVGPGRIRHRP